MYEVEIYITTDSVSPRECERKYGYVLECQKNGNALTREGFGKITGTWNKATLKAITEAMERVNQSCQLTIHTENEYVLNMMDHNLSKWAGNGFATSRGKPVTNREEWIQLWEHAKKHIIRTAPGRHSYTGWILSEIGREMKDGKL